MHLVDILKVRSHPCRGVYFAITRKCPLSCAHCLSDSTMESDERSAGIYQKFAETMTIENHPEILMLTGGEPLLRPNLVRSISFHSKNIGTKVGIATGAYFAKYDKVPRSIQEAIEQVDMITVSIDEFHEREVPRVSVFKAIRWMLDLGKFVHIQTVGYSPFDDYVNGLLAAVKANFSEDVPVFVAKLSPVGRASEWLETHNDAFSSESGCMFASWPVVTYHGVIAACCNQDVVNGPVPAHLQIGHAQTHSWEDVTRYYKNDKILEVIRVRGPAAIASLGKDAACNGCETCKSLSKNLLLRSQASKISNEPFSIALKLIRENANFDIADLTISGYEDWLRKGYLCHD